MGQIIHPERQVLRFNWRRAAYALLGVGGLAACDTKAITAPSDADPVSRVAVVVNRIDRTLSLIPFGDTGTPRLIDIGLNYEPQDFPGEPTDVEVSGNRALVTARRTVLLVNLANGVVTHRLLLGGPGAQDEVRAVAVLGDTLAVAAATGTGTLVPFNPQTGRVFAPVPVPARNPVELLAAGGRLFLLNAPPGGAGEVVVLDAALRTVGTVRLTGTQSRTMALRGPSLYVLNAGAPGTASGSVSVMDTASLRESAVLPGFGESPGSMAFGSGGELYVAVPAAGLMIYSTATRAFLRGPDALLTGNGLGGVWRVAPDPAGFVYALQVSGCQRAGALVRLDASGATVASAPTGVCPWDVEFATLTER